MTQARFLLALVCCCLLPACTTTTITNLTPSKLPRNATGLYPFEALFASDQKTLRKDSLQPSVIVGLEPYPMQRAPMLKNRWETVVPVPADKNFLNYRFKFDYEYDSIPKRRSGSVLSRPYQLEIVDQ